MTNSVKIQYENFQKEQIEKENLIIENLKKALLIKYPNISSPIVLVEGNWSPVSKYDNQFIFYIGDIRTTVNFNYSPDQSDFKLSFKFSLNATEEDILKILNLNFNNLDNSIEMFFKAAKFYNVFEKFEKINSPITSKMSDNIYLSYFKYYRVYYNESFRQKKSTTSVPNKSSFIESQFYIVYDVEKNKIIEKYKVKFPFLYKTKINEIFNINEELDSDFLLEELKKTYKNLTVKHINNSLKLKLKSNLITDEELFRHISLLSIFKY